MTTPRQALQRAAEIIQTRGLHKHSMGRYGEPRCAAGALAEACGDTGSGLTAKGRDLFLEAREALRRSSGLTGLIADWNDAPERTADDVIKALQQAALT